MQKLSHTVGLNALRITNLTAKIIQATNSDSLVSIQGNDIEQLVSILQLNIKRLKQNLQNKTDLAATVASLENDVELLLAIIIEDDDSVYQLRLQQLSNTKTLQLIQQKSIAILTIIMATLDQLSILVNSKSMTAVNKSVQVAETARWAILLLSIMIIVGMVFFIRSISKGINASLAAVRNAMHALSAKKFSTRLQVQAGNNEFALLAKDFNVFASNNQLLIEDLAKAKDTVQIREQHISTILSGVPEAILTLSTSGVIQSSNPAAERVLKVNKTTLIGLNLNRFLTTVSGLTLVDLKNKVEESHELEGRDYNGQPFSMWLSLNSISSKNQEDAWVCVISDITAWKKAEENLKTTSAELDAILENAMVGIVLIKNRTIMRVNNKFEQLFVCDRASIEGQSTRLLYPSDEIYRR